MRKAAAKKKPAHGGDESEGDKGEAIKVAPVKKAGPVGAKRPRRKLKHAASTTDLNFATKRGADEAEFLTRIEGAFAKVVAAR